MAAGSSLVLCHACGVPEQQPEVPEAVEEFLIGLSAAAGQLGGGIGGGLAGHGGAGGRGGARGGARAARMLKTIVEQRAGVAPGTPDQVVARLIAALPAAMQLPADDHVRFAVPVGRTGLQQIVVDLVFGLPATTPSGPGVQVRLCGYGKEGLLSRKPTRTVTDRAWSVVIT